VRHAPTRQELFAGLETMRLRTFFFSSSASVTASLAAQNSQGRPGPSLVTLHNAPRGELKQDGNPRDSSRISQRFTNGIDWGYDLGLADFPLNNIHYMELVRTFITRNRISSVVHFGLATVTGSFRASFDWS